MPLLTTRKAAGETPAASRLSATDSATAMMRTAEPMRRYLMNLFSRRLGAAVCTSEWACQTICSVCPRSRSSHFASQAATLYS